jgi:fructose-bisphosphate aldolase class II
MPHVSTDELIGSPIVAANVITLEQAEAYVEASEMTGISLILQLSENTVDFHGALAPLAGALVSMARDCHVPLGVHLDHATREELVEEAVDLGITSVMFDASLENDQANSDRTAALVAKLHPRGVWVEGEIGEIGGKGGAHAPGALTTVEDAVNFVAQTKVDGLAIAVGSSHHMKEKAASLNLERIREISQAVQVPLVLHGSSGVPLSDLREGLAAGIVKVNVATEFNAIFTSVLRSETAAQPSIVDPRVFLRAGRVALRDAMVKYLQQLHAPEPTLSPTPGH